MSSVCYIVCLPPKVESLSVTIHLAPFTLYDPPPPPTPLQYQTPKWLSSGFTVGTGPWPQAVTNGRVCE